MKRRWMTLVLALCLMGCGGTSMPPPDEIGVPSTVMDPGEHLLVEPMGNPESLLGRRVTKRSDGGYEIADGLAPGCKVAVKKRPSSWHRAFHQNVDDVAGFGLSLGRFVKLKAEYEKGVRLETEVDNTHTLEADLSGSCEGMVILSVKVGSGKREFQFKQSIEGGAHVGWKSIEAGGEGGRTAGTDASLSWNEPQAWAFRVNTVNDANQAEISIQMPERLKPKEQFAPEITAGPRDLWLIVISCWGDGRCEVLRPSSKVPTEVVPAGGSMKLWPMDAEAAPDGGESRERMVVYGFPEEGDFKTFSPPAGALSEQEASDYSRSLEERLVEKQEIPSRRWARAEFRYVVEGDPNEDEGVNP